MSKGLAQIMKQAQMMQQKMGKLQEEAAERTAEVTTGGGAVTVVVNGKNQVLSLVIKKEAVDPEDVEATIYSAMGIDYTKVRQDDPFHRGFEYVPFSSTGAYGPINELFS